MGAHGAYRIQERGSVMELEVVQGFGIVRTPVLYKIGEHGRVETSAAACAAFKHDIGMRFDNAVQDPVQAQNITV
jgi:hypothetical protein